MPLFGSNKNKSPPSPPPQQAPQQYDNYDSQPNRKGSIFSRRSAEQPRQAPYDDPAMHPADQQSTRSGGGGLFSRNRRSSDDMSYGGSTRSGAFTQDHSITGARDKVFQAEAAERAADQALAAARGAVREARDHVRMLEREAVEEARRAKIKSEEAKHVSKSARGLGRHG
ncbi:unnamed protein product [Peniophora sp. CBMAI 1063]|nr:unnamed protein product [Peniophora sp. CBMAI 1063]